MLEKLKKQIILSHMIQWLFILMTCDFCLYADRGLLSSLLFRSFLSAQLCSHLFMKYI